jgi:hypothetical protein
MLLCIYLCLLCLHLHLCTTLPPPPTMNYSSIASASALLSHFLCLCTTPPLPPPPPMNYSAIVSASALLCHCLCLCTTPPLPPPLSYSVTASASVVLHHGTPPPPPPMYYSPSASTYELFCHRFHLCTIPPLPWPLYCSTMILRLHLCLCTTLPPPPPMKSPCTSDLQMMYNIYK